MSWSPANPAGADDEVTFHSMPASCDESAVPV